MMLGRRIASALLFGSMLTAGCGAVDKPLVATIRVDRSAPSHTVSPLIFGSNLQWQQDGDGLLDRDPSAPRLVAAALQSIKASGVTALRFPGGDLANTYRWKTATGPIARRGEGRDYGGNSVAQRFGSDEFLALCETLRLAPIMTVNANAPIEEAADWVEHVNRPTASERSVRADYWEVGNEVFNPTMPGFESAERYGRKVAAFAKAMRLRDPSIKVGAVLDASFQDAAWVAKALPHLVDWNETVLRTAGSSIDFVSLHFYAPQDKVFSDATLRQLVLASPVELSKALLDVEQLLRRHARPGTTIALTEFAPAFGDKLLLSSRIATTEAALFDALVLFAAIRHPAVVAANNWSLANNSVFGMITIKDDGTVAQRPTYDVYRMLAPLAGGRSLGLSIATDTIAVAAHGTVPALDRVPLVDAIAVDGRDRALNIALVNRHDSQAAEVRIVDDRLPVRVSVASLTASPGSATWTVRNATASSEAGILTVQVPPHSLTLLSGAIAAPTGSER